MPKIRTSRILPTALAVLALVCFLRFPDTTADAAREALSMTAHRLLPALFPYMVVSSLIVRRDLLATLNRVLPLNRLLHLPGSANSVLLTGWIAGFPVGASGAAQLYRQGEISKRDAERLAAVSSAASPAFLVSAVAGMWGDARFGWVLLGLNLTALLLFGLLTANRRDSLQTAAEYVPANPKPRSFAADMSIAISDAGTACLGVTAFITFFRILSAVAGRLCPPLAPVFSLVFEFSEGASAGAAVGGVRGAAMCGFAVGFSGLCVLMQIASRLTDAGLSLRSTVLSRLLAAAVLSLGAALYARLSPMTPAAETVLTTPEASVLPVFFWFAALFLAKIHPRLHNFSRKT